MPENEAKWLRIVLVGLDPIVHSSIMHERLENLALLHVLQHRWLDEIHYTYFAIRCLDSTEIAMFTALLSAYFQQLLCSRTRTNYSQQSMTDVGALNMLE